MIVKMRFQGQQEVWKIQLGQYEFQADISGLNLDSMVCDFIA